jgi:hypothetical protein
MLPHITYTMQKKLYKIKKSFEWTQMKECLWQGRENEEDFVTGWHPEVETSKGYVYNNEWMNEWINQSINQSVCNFC